MLSSYNIISVNDCVLSSCSYACTISNAHTRMHDVFVNTQVCISVYIHQCTMSACVYIVHAHFLHTHACIQHMH